MPDAIQRAVITASGRVYELDDAAQGVPVETYFADALLPETLKGALVYDTLQGKIIAFPTR